MERLNYGKFAFTLADRKTLRAVRVSVRPEVLEMAVQGPFFEARRKGIPPSEIPVDINREAVERLFSKPDEELFAVQTIERYELPRTQHTFVFLRCSICGGLVAENRVRLKEPVCIPCSD